MAGRPPRWGLPLKLRHHLVGFLILGQEEVGRGAFLLSRPLLLLLVNSVAPYALTDLPSATIHLSARTAWSLRKRLPAATANWGMLQAEVSQALGAPAPSHKSLFTAAGEFYKGRVKSVPTMDAVPLAS